MHMPDGILPLNQAIVYLVLAGVIVLISIWQSRNSLTLKQIPVVGVLAAGLFAAQMFNFPVPFGSSGHLIGTALATVLVGPWAAILILASILIIQAFFGDGGLLALGANTLNMAILGAFSVVVIFLLIPKKWRTNRYAYAGFAAGAAFISTITMAIAASAELSIAQTGPPGLIFGWMLGLHAIIGLAEAAITFTVVSFIFLADVSLLTAAENSLSLKGKAVDFDTEKPAYKFPVGALVSSLIVFGVMSIFGIVASENPDGLERTFSFLEEAGYSITEFDSGLFGFPDGIGWAILQMAIIMTLLFGIILLVNFIIFKVKVNRYQQKDEPNENSEPKDETDFQTDELKSLDG